MANITSPNMSLTIPTVGSEAGPTYAFDINASLTLIDQHDHSPGRGVQITTAGLNINTDLSLNGFSLIDATTIVFLASVSASTTPMSLSVAPGGEAPPQQDLWFTPDTGIPIQITKNGIVNATASSIDGESYAGGTFFWTQAQDALPTTPANFDIGSITLRPNVALTTFGVTLSPPSAITSQYQINLPLLPASQKIMTLDASGNMTAPYTVDGSTITIVSNVIGVPAGGITNTQIAMNTITGNRLVNETVGFDQLAPGFNAVWNEELFTNATPSFVVRAATTVNGTLATAFDNASVIDGVTLVTNDIILVKNQTTSQENGVYVVQASGAPVRQASYDTFSELNYAGVSVTLGTVNTGTSWFQNLILASLSDPQLWSISATTTFTVPANVNKLIIRAVGGGGGGGSGGRGDGTSNHAGGGGAGGGGAIPQVIELPVTPGLVLTITTGGGGGGGAGSPGTGNDPGVDGANTTITGTNVNLVFGGGQGGLQGGDGAAGTAPGAADTDAVWGPTGSSSFGGGGGNGSASGQAGTAGGPSTFSNTTAAAGIAQGTKGGGGGGGGAGAAAGGAGGNGRTNIAGNDGTNGALNSSGGGGGGGGGENAGGTVGGGDGGNGGSGFAYIYWLGEP